MALYADLNENMGEFLLGMVNPADPLNLIAVALAPFTGGASLAVRAGIEGLEQATKVGVKASVRAGRKTIVRRVGREVGEEELERQAVRQAKERALGDLGADIGDVAADAIKGKGKRKWLFFKAAPDDFARDQVREMTEDVLSKTVDDFAEGITRSGRVNASSFRTEFIKNYRAAVRAGDFDNETRRILAGAIDGISKDKKFAKILDDMFKVSQGAQEVSTGNFARRALSGFGRGLDDIGQGVGRKSAAAARAAGEAGTKPSIIGRGFRKLEAAELKRVKEAFGFPDEVWDDLIRFTDGKFDEIGDIGDLMPDRLLSL